MLSLPEQRYKNEIFSMDNDTLIIVGLLAIAICWWCVIHIQAERKAIRKCNKDRAESQERAEKVRRLTNKL
jgi:hypothetical protein